jgi:hypothetical protein
MRYFWLDLSGPAQGSAAGSCEDGKKFSYLMKDRELFKERNELPISLSSKTLLCGIS